MNPFHFGDAAPTPETDARCTTVPAGLATKEELFTFLQEALPLPNYFGKNWDALEECLGEWTEALDAPWTLVHQDVPPPGNSNGQRTYLQILAALRSKQLRIIFPERQRHHITHLLSSR